MDRLAASVEELPEPHSPHHRDVLVRGLAGTYSASWNRLKEATVSSAQAAVQGTSLAYGTWARIEKRRAPAAESDFLTDQNYRAAVFGPALGAILLAAFAQESFLRLGYVAALASTRGRGARAMGPDSRFKARLTAFDEMPTKARIAILRRAVGFSYDQPLERAVAELAGYRDEIAHDSPILHLDSGSAQKVRQTGRGNSTRFEPLYGEHRPARLKHVVRAIRIHDDFVRHALRTARSRNWVARVESFAGLLTSMADYMPGSGWWRSAQKFAHAWEDGPERRRATDAEVHEWRTEMVQRALLKSAPKGHPA